jgi:putative endonuclease
MSLFGRWRATPDQRTSRQRSGDAAEDAALAFLQQQGMRQVERNFRCQGGEIDLIMQEQDTLVFVEVRRRSSASHGGALASVTRTKQRRLLLAAQVFLQRYRQPPACRFDVIGYDGEQMTWLKNALEAMPDRD